jgi:glycosyltransferase involved in cell wall biosynthesis
LRPALEEFARDHGLNRIIFAGFQNIGALSRYYAAADLFVLPSGQGETWGLVVNEALCFGLPVIVSDRVGSAADLVKEGENGYRFPLGDRKALEERLRMLLDDSRLRESFGTVSRKTVRQYSFETDIEGIFHAIKSAKSGV